MLSDLRSKWDASTPRVKMFVGIGALCVIFVLPALLLFYHQSVYSAKITLTFAPKSATVKIGDTGGSFGDNAVKPGTYKIEISKKGFATFTKTVTVAGGKTELVEAALQSNDPSTENWYTDNVDDYSIAQGIGDRRADREYEYMTKIFPIAKALPIVGINSTYRVDYGISPTNSSKYAIFISYDVESDKQDAIAAIKSKGYNPDDYEAIYQQNDAITYGAIAISGVSSFSKRGVSAEDVNTIQEALVQKLTSFQGTQVTKISVTSDVSHSMSSDRTTDTYTATLQLNGTYDRRLTVVIRSGQLTVSVGATDGSGSTTLYTGESK